MNRAQLLPQLLPQLALPGQTQALVKLLLSRGVGL